VTEYRIGRKAFYQLRRAGLSREDMAQALDEFARVCPCPSDTLFIPFALERSRPATERARERVLGIGDWAPSAALVEQLVNEGYGAEFISEFALPQFIDESRLGEELPIDCEVSFAIFLRNRFPMAPRETIYGWYPSVGHYCELQWRGHSRVNIHHCLNLFRPLISSDDGEALTGRKFIGFVSGWWRGSD